MFTSDYFLAPYLCSNSNNEVLLRYKKINIKVNSLFCIEMIRGGIQQRLDFCQSI